MINTRKRLSAAGLFCALTLATPVVGQPRLPKARITESVPLAGFRVLGAAPLAKSASLSDLAYQELTARASANQNGFSVYQDEDSGFNHGYPSGEFGDLSVISIDAGCIDDPSDTITGCFPSTDTVALDEKRGTVLRVSFDPLPNGHFAGLNIEEPENWGAMQTGQGYDLTGATSIVFDARSPAGATIQFGVGGCVSNFIAVPTSWTPLTIPLSSLVTGGSPVSCPPDLSNVHILFAITADDIHDSAGATILLDNIHFLPNPSRVSQGSETLSLPLSTQTYGVVPQLSNYPPDQVNRNVASTYESALTILALLERGAPADLTNALSIANAFDYALKHDNHGDPVPIAPDGSVGLHNAYASGDIAFLNSQQFPKLGQAGDVRLAGFSVPSVPPAFDLVLDGATGGNNAFAILALGAAYLQSGNESYLDDARTIGRWITSNLVDSTGTGFGGYFLGYPDEGVPPPKPLIQGKSTENNADIFAALNLLAQIDTANATMWTMAANAAGDFVVSMFDSANGRFFAGTVVQADALKPGPGVCPDLQLTKGNDVVNTCDFIDSNTFTLLAMAGSERYAGQIDWTRPTQYVLSGFAQSISAGGLAYQGFDIVPAPVSGNNGVAWEFTGQTAETCSYVNSLLGSTTFLPCVQSYSAQIAQAQTSAPFADGLGVVASTLDGENQPPNNFPPVDSCLNTPFQCIPERVGLAATNWAIFAEDGENPLAPSNVPVCRFTLSPTALYFQSNGGSTSLDISSNDQRCTWLASTNASWIALSPPAGTGAQTLGVTAAPNTSAFEQMGTITAAGRTIQVTEWLTTQVFSDVPPTVYYFDAVNLLKARGITSGCSPTEYCPAESVTRAQMAVFIVRAVTGGDNFTYSPVPYFTDVQPADFGFAWIQKLYELGITAGCAPSLYCPNDSITRSQMAVFIIRARYGAETTFDYPADPYFTDVPPTGFAYSYIQRMKEDNITSGCSATTYCPDSSVTRGDMAMFVMRGAFNQLLPMAEPTLAGVSPTTLANGTSATLTITGLQTHFVSGATTLNVVPGLVVNSVTVVNATTLTANVTAETSSAPQPLSIWVTDSTEEAVLPNGLLVQ